MDNYAHFVRLLATDAITVRALTEVVDPAECGKLATSLVAIGVQTDSIQAILRAIISAEFSNTQHAETVMRAGSCSTKMIADYLNRIASKYLQFTLQDTVSSVIGRSDLNLEVDPDKLGPGESLEGQQHLLQQTAEEFVSRIVSAEAFDAMPMEMKYALVMSLSEWLYWINCFENCFVCSKTSAVDWWLLSCNIN
eukprot:TRINITY_DN6396_c0_g1_i4.p1 TRINITY_DN6396_c0_g1~~TRINITY_DN6396_c0_g1_i4.p1  ORF type:complete len:195 (+),score=24.52 TRINITY_DN6396_c0_g1_i4:51-635(+)